MTDFVNDIGPMSLSELDTPMTLAELDIDTVQPNKTVKRTVTCSFCQEKGHCFTKCANPSIEELKQKMDDAFVVNVVFIVEPAYIKARLDQLSVHQLKMLAFTNNVCTTTNKKMQTKSYYIKKLLETVYNIEQATTPENSPHAPLTISTEISKKFKEMSDEVVETHLEIMKMFWPSFGDNLIKRFYNLRDYRRYNILFTAMPKSGILDIQYMSILPSSVKDHSEQEECPICFETMTSNKVILNCGHSVCSMCVTQNLKHLSSDRNYSNPKCAICRTKTLAMTFSDAQMCTHVKVRFDVSPYYRKTPYKMLDELKDMRSKLENDAKKQKLVIEKLEKQRRFEECMVRYNLQWLAKFNKMIESTQMRINPYTMVWLIVLFIILFICK